METNYSHQINFVIGESMPLIGQEYNCNVLTLTNDSIIFEPFTINTVTTVLKLTSQIIRISSNGINYILLLPKSAKCSAIKILKCNLFPSEGNRINGELLTDISIIENGIITKWEPLETSRVVRMSSIDNIPIAVTNNALYYCITDSCSNTNNVFPIKQIC